MINNDILAEIFLFLQAPERVHFRAKDDYSAKNTAPDARKQKLVDRTINSTIHRLGCEIDILDGNEEELSR